MHSDTGKQCNYLTWLSRGWCRAELWCRLLSNREDTSVVVVFSPKEAEFIFPLDWQENRISDGLFTVESDRAEVVKLGEMALTSKLDHLRFHGPFTHYRFYLARQNQLLNKEKEEWDLPGFLKFFDFSLESAVQETNGMTGMLCAVLAGDVNIIQKLVEHGANPNGRALGLGDMGYYDSQTLLMVAAKSGQDALVLSALLKASADCNLLSRAGIDPLWLARRPGHVHVLLAARATIHGPSSTNPLNGVAGRGSADTVRVFLESRCDPAKASIDGFAPLHALPLFGRSNPDVFETTRLLLAYRANVNVQCETQIKDRLFVFEVVRASVTVALWGLAHADPYWRKLASIPGATPLTMAAMQGDKGLVKLLLELEAEVDIPNERGDTPEALALLSGHQDVAQLLSMFHVWTQRSCFLGCCPVAIGFKDMRLWSASEGHK